MDLPADDHSGWDLLLAAVLDSEESVEQPSTEVKILDLQSLYARSGVLSGGGVGTTATI